MGIPKRDVVPLHVLATRPVRRNPTPDRVVAMSARRDGPTGADHGAARAEGENHAKVGKRPEGDLDRSRAGVRRLLSPEIGRRTPGQSGEGSLSSGSAVPPPITARLGREVQSGHAGKL